MSEMLEISQVTGRLALATRFPSLRGKLLTQLLHHSEFCVNISMSVGTLNAVIGAMFLA